ncbi:hypothetical protein [Agrobacterium tumefaciens]|uniref:Uncharacterized protein n=1 Tax=Agrobacterium tumefaciens TaxID=358 RepID=A0A2L2LM96_AGRTU|nr:hypothetical protein [Agrobacterium tumefaciens]AVH45449.1 hypothetical protein At1D1609_54170 [Agrobacterium tumefaciens]NSY99177.1 hypothetical protein [Agrobacterium tumefaciens]
MRQQTKPFIIKIKQSRKLRATDRKPSIWGKLDLTSDQHALADSEPKELSAVAGDNDRP